MQREHRNRPIDRQRQGIVLDRRDGVLQARVVELHHVRAGGAVVAETAREVHVHHVETARAETEVERLHVDDQLVADPRGPDQPHVGDRLAPLTGRAGQLHEQTLLGALRRVGVDHDRAA